LQPLENQSAPDIRKLMRVSGAELFAPDSVKCQRSVLDRRLRVAGILRAFFSEF